MKIERIYDLNQIIQQTADKFFSQKTELVFGDGNLDAKIILIGEAPGESEVIEKKPFVGKAGKNLTEFLEVLNIKREDIYITNVCKFRPININEKTKKISNRTPNKKEIKLFSDYLKKEINIISPKIIVTLGNIALRCILDDDSAAIGEYHGKLILRDSYNIFPLYHPASIIYRRELKDIYLDDLKVLKEYIYNFL